MFATAQKGSLKTSKYPNCNLTLEGQDMTTITNTVRWLALNGLGTSQIIGNDAWISFGWVHFAFNNKFECERIQFGVSAG